MEVAGQCLTARKTPDRVMLEFQVDEEGKAQKARIAKYLEIR